MDGIYQMRIARTKNLEKDIISGFMQHYVELVKALPFDLVRTNLPISGLYTGDGGSPAILLPSTSEWVDLSADNYQTFHPSLLWVTNRHPQMRFTIENNYVAGILHDKHIALELQWDPPLSLGTKLDRKIDLFRGKDI